VFVQQHHSFIVPHHSWDTEAQALPELCKPCFVPYPRHTPGDVYRNNCKN